METNDKDWKTISLRRAPDFRPFSVAVIGASGVVGSETLSILHERGFPVSEVRALASARSAGNKVDFGDEELTIEELTPEALDGVEIAFFAAGGSVSKEYCHIAAKKGAVCIDKSSVYRLDDDVPLVVPGVNSDALAGYAKKNIVATPNCSTTQLVQVLKPLHDKATLNRVVCSTYQAVSGAGREGIDELDAQVRAMFNMRDVEDMKIFKRRIAFNALPCIPGAGAFTGEFDATNEEQKMVDETRKILGIKDLKVGVTCVRIPVFNGHSESVHMSFDHAITRDEALELLAAQRDVQVMDDPKKHLYPTPEDAVGKDHTLVGRVRKDPSSEHGIALFCVSDNLRTGAALNAVRIAEALCEHHLS